jgi:hypothetical protein
MGRHVKQCAHPDGDNSIELFAKGSTYDKYRLRLLMAKWSAKSHRPFLIARDSHFVEILKMFNLKVEIPSPTTISRDIREIHELTRLELAKRLQVSWTV